MKSDIDVDKLVRYSVYFAFFIAWLFVAFKSLSYPYLCYDEAGQFYISKGLPHGADPYSAYSDVQDVIHYNRYFNLDPGGFSVLLHYWSLLNNHYVYLRLLPFLFFMGALGGTYKIGMNLFKNRYHAVLLVSVILFTGVFAHLAGEIRAYSMELCGVILSLCFLQKNIGTLTTKRLVLLALILVFFMTSRYSFAVYAFSVSLCVTFFAFRQRGLFRSILPILIYAFIVLSGVLLVYFVTMRYQNAGAKPLDYVQYFGKDFEYLKLNGLSRCYYIIMIYAVWCYFKKIPQNSIIIVSLVVSTVFIILSLANHYPWDEKRALPVTICLYLSVGIMILRHLKDHHTFLAGLFILCFFKLYDAKYENTWWRQQGKDLFDDFEYCANNMKSEDRIYVGARLSPQVRYLFEEGVWKDKYASLYSSCSFGKGASHNMNGEKLDIDVITAEDVDAQFYLMTKATLDKLNNPALFKQCEGHSLLYVKVIPKDCN